MFFRRKATRSTEEAKENADKVFAALFGMIDKTSTRLLDLAGVSSPSWEKRLSLNLSLYAVHEKLDELLGNREPYLHDELFVIGYIDHLSQKPCDLSKLSRTRDDDVLIAKSIEKYRHAPFKKRAVIGELMFDRIENLRTFTRDASLHTFHHIAFDFVEADLPMRAGDMIQRFGVGSYLESWILALMTVDR